MMEKPKLETLIHQAGRAAAHGWSRRQAMQTMLGTAGAGLVLPGLAAGHPMRGHLMNGEGPEAANQAAGAEWEPIFLDAHQNATLIVLGERLVPNSAAAQANRFIDTLLSVESQENQKEFVAALSAFEHEAIARHDQPFKDLSGDQQIAILTAASTEQPSKPLEFGRRRRPSAAPAGAGVEEPAPTLRDHFENLKGWVAGSYYSSEAGMKELGWTGQMVWESYPGCEHPDGHA
ncbi:MAG TPA: gluconate 2-dehydrogenase subunit 3 family protein [Terriglobia bacterium]|nr:gluconate 2-dehydrogenase subunit 3 family protein [Terriglobia bacterium]